MKFKPGQRCVVRHANHIWYKDLVRDEVEVVRHSGFAVTVRVLDPDKALRHHDGESYGIGYDVIAEDDLMPVLRDNQSASVLLKQL